MPKAAACASGASRLCIFVYLCTTAQAWPWSSNVPSKQRTRAKRTSRPCRNQVPPSVLNFRALPLEVERQGVELLGHHDAYHKLVAKTAPPTAIRIADGRCIWLVQHPKDNSAKRLVREVPLDEYGLRRLHNGGLMVDVGANLGDQSIAAHLWDPTLQVLAIEPVPVTFFFLLWNLHLNGVPRLPLSSVGAPSTAARAPGVVAMHAAIAGKGAPPTISLRWSASQSQDASLDLSAHGGTAPGGAGKKWKTSLVKAVHLPSLLQSANAPMPLRLLKLDCEGCEYLLVASAGSWFTDRRNVLRVAGERHPFLGLANRTRETLASKVPMDNASVAERLFKARGCRGGWRLDCR